MQKYENRRPKTERRFSCGREINEEGKKEVPTFAVEGMREGCKGGMSFTSFIIRAKCDKNMIWRQKRRGGMRAVSGANSGKTIEVFCPMCYTDKKEFLPRGLCRAVWRTS